MGNDAVEASSSSDVVPVSIFRVVLLEYPEDGGSEILQNSVTVRQFSWLYIPEEWSDRACLAQGEVPMCNCLQW
jgi:hypothetical protein